VIIVVTPKSCEGEVLGGACRVDLKEGDWLKPTAIELAINTAKSATNAMGIDRRDTYNSRTIHREISWPTHLALVVAVPAKG
jgi:hypothetical protein